VEAEALGRIGIHDALSRLAIDARCRITTPCHQAAGRLRERLRGFDAHGTCGVGVGETVLHALRHPGQTVHYSDLLSAGGAHSQKQIDKIQAIRESLLAEFAPHCEKSDSALAGELRVLRDESLAGKWLAQSQALARQCPPASTDAIRGQLQQPGTVLFEGAQGILLDEWRGFHPHTTWSSITTGAIELAAASAGILDPIEHFGVLRSYLTRHGVGPLPTHDPSLDALLPEPHNHGDGWQGRFRRGHPDAVLLRYALESIGSLSGLFISHLDVFSRGITLRWCEHYSLPSGQTELARLPVSTSDDLAHQAGLTKLLQDACPHYAANPITSPAELLAHIATVTSIPVALTSHGPSFRDIR
jgi:adenylosuccinate synthase